MPSANTKQAVILSDFEKSSQWSLGTGATFAADDKLYGIYALKLSTSGTAVADFVTNLDLTSGYLGAWVKTNNPLNIASFAIWCQVGGTWGKFFQYSANDIIRPNDSGIWLHDTFPKSNYSMLSGAAPTDWSNITAIRFSLQASGNQTANVWVNRLERYERMLSGGFVTCFIDDTIYVYPAWSANKIPICQSYNFWPTWAFFCSPADGSVWNALQNWIASGSDCAVHSYDSTTGNAINAADDTSPAGRFKIEWNVAYAKLPFYTYSLGRFAKFFVYNGGTYSPLGLEMVNEHYALARATGQGYESWPPEDRVRLRAREGVYPLASLQSLVSTAVSNGEWLILYQHGWLTTTEQLASWMYGQGYSMYNLSTAWSLLKGLYPREVVEDNPVREVVHETWTQVPSTMTSAIVMASGMSALACYQVWAYAGGVYTDETTAAGNDTVNDMTLMPSTGGASGDAYYFGFSGFSVLDTNFHFNLWINMGTAGSGTVTLAWEYLIGGWSTVQYVADNTSSFRGTTGWKYVYIWPNLTHPTWSMWTVGVVSGVSAYWIRARLTVGSYTTVPSGTRAAYAAQYGEPVTGFSQPVPPRVLFVTSTNNSGGNAGTIYIYGRDALGECTYDAIAVGGQGSNPFASITAASMVGGPLCMETLYIGWTSKLGLSRKLMYPPDVLVWQKNASLGSPGVVALNRALMAGWSNNYGNTLDVGTIASGDEYHLWYVARDIARKPLRDNDP